MSTANLMLIHGMWGCGDDWLRYREFFESRGFRVQAPALRHHERRDNPEVAGTGIGDYVEDLREQVLSMDKPRVAVGHSMGGLLALILSTEPHLLQAAVLLAPAPPAGYFTPRLAALRLFRQHVLRTGSWEKPYRPEAERARRAVFNNLEPSEQDKQIARFRYESGRAINEIGYWFLDRNRRTRIDPDSPSCPLLFIGAKKDRITPAKAVRRIARRFDAEYTEYPEHAHWIIGEPGWEKPAAFIGGWIGRQLG